MYAFPEEKDFFLKHLNKKQNVLEWGSGSSTAVIAEKVKSVVSIEHNREWYGTVSKNLPSNAKLHFVPPKYQHDWRVDGDGSPDNFKKYISYPVELGNKYDLILIDGRARVKCASVCSKISKEDTMIFVHDFSDERISEGYDKMYEYLELIERVRSMALFKLKS